MDASIPGAALTANRGRGGPPRKLEAEFFFERLAKIVAFQFGDELTERGPVRELSDRKTSALRNLWIVGVDLRARFGSNKTRDDEKFERRPGHRRRFQG